MTHSFTFFSIPLCMSFFSKGGLIKLMNEMHDNTCARLREARLFASELCSPSGDLMRQCLRDLSNEFERARQKDLYA